MNKSFLKCESSAESAFRIFICSAALIMTLVSAAHGIGGMISESTFKEGLLRDAFSVAKVSKLSAYYYEDFFRECEAFNI